MLYSLESGQYDTTFNFGDEVGHCLHEEDQRGFVTAIILRPGLPESIMYAVTWTDGRETTHYDFELTTARYAGVSDE